MSINYIPRVTQLDAVQLDKQVEELFKHLVFQATKYLEPGILQPILPELELIIRTWLFKYSIWNQKCTFGQQMLSLKYNTENFSKTKLYWYYGYNIGLNYFKQRAIYSFTSNTKLQNFIHILESFQIFCDALNFIRFIQSGKYPNLIDLILGIELTADKLTREDLRDFSWTRELLWHNLIELLGTTISLMNIFGLKTKMSNVFKTVWWRKYYTISSSDKSAVMTLSTVCAFCSQNPVLPHTMGCSHIFCYYCLSGNKTSNRDFTCPKCNYNGHELKKYSLMKEEPLS